MSTYGGPAWPVEYSTGVIFGTILQTSGYPFDQEIIGYAPTISFTPRAAVSFVDGDPVLVYAQTVTVPLEADGTFTVELPATDDPDVRPQNFTYMVDENWPNGRQYDIDVPSGSNRDLASITKLQDTPGVMKMVGPPGPTVLSVTLNGSNQLVFHLADGSDITGPDLVSMLAVVDGGAADSTYTSTVDGGSASG